MVGYCNSGDWACRNGYSVEDRRSPGPSAIVPYISTSLPPAAVAVNRPLRDGWCLGLPAWRPAPYAYKIAVRQNSIATPDFCLARLRFSNQPPASGSPAVVVSGGEPQMSTAIF